MVAVRFDFHYETNDLYLILVRSYLVPLHSRAFAPPASFVPRTRVVQKGYLDDLSGELYGEVDNPDLEQTREATEAKETDRYGVQVRARMLDDTLDS